MWEDLDHDGVQDSGEPGIAGVLVTLQTPTGTITTPTNANGLYTFTNLISGTHAMTFTAPSGYTGTLANVGSDLTDSDANPITGATGPITVNAGQVMTDMDAGFWRPASMGDLVWQDLDNDGVQDSGEPGIPGVRMTLNGLDAQGAPFSQTLLTDASGQYTFTRLIPGTYTITVSNLPSGLLASYDLDDGHGPFTTPNSAAGIALTTGMTRTDVDFGYVPVAPVTGRVWVDDDKDSVRNGVEITGVPGVTITLLDLSGNVVSTTTTGPNGQYTFTNITIGTYVISETQPIGYGSSTPNIISITLQPSGSATNDFGETQASLSGGAYYDANNNGVRDASEPSIPGVVVSLSGTDAQGNVINQSASTDANGNYTFTHLLSGTYTLIETQPVGYIDGLETVGSTGGTLTPPDSITNITLDGGEDATSYNFGELGTTIRGSVWIDLNKDGVLDGIESRAYCRCVDSSGGQPGQPERQRAHGCQRQLHDHKHLARYV